MNQNNLLKIVKSANPLLPEHRAAEVAEALDLEFGYGLTWLEEARRVNPDVDGFRVAALCDRPEDQDAFSLVAVVCTFDGEGTLLTSGLEIVGPNEDMGRWEPTFAKASWTWPVVPLTVAEAKNYLAVVDATMDPKVAEDVANRLIDGHHNAMVKASMMDFSLFPSVDCVLVRVPIDPAPDRVVKVAEVRMCLAFSGKVLDVKKVWADVDPDTDPTATYVMFGFRDMF